MAGKGMCPKGQTKRAYSSEDAAIHAALKYSGKRGTPLRVYHHKECGHWHLTSKPAWGFDKHTRGAATAWR